MEGVGKIQPFSTKPVTREGASKLPTCFFSQYASIYAAAVASPVSP